MSGNFAHSSSNTVGSGSGGGGVGVSVGVIEALLPSLPVDVREKLAELDLELSEGDITQKGFEKKRAKLLQQYLPKNIVDDQQQQQQQYHADDSKCINRNNEKPLPTYYNMKDTPQQQTQVQNNAKTAKDGSTGAVPALSSEGYSYVTEVPSLPSSHPRHSNVTKKSDFYYASSGSNQVAANEFSVAATGVGGGSSAGGGGGGSSGGGSGSGGYQHGQHSRQRRTQRKITHNEKRYHSGKFS